MFEARVTVDLPGIADAIHDLACAIRGTARPATVQAMPECIPAAPVPAPDPEPIPVAPVPAPDPEPIPVAPVPAPEPEPIPVAEAPVATPAEEQPAPAKKYTFEQISKAGAALCADLSKMEKLVSLLNDKYKVPAITMIDESKYTDLANDLIALGAVIEEA